MKNDKRFDFMGFIKWSIAAFVVIALAVIAFRVVRDSPMRQGIKEEIIAAGSFHQVAHMGEGRATLYKMLNGDRELHLSDFRTGEGQGLEVYLISAPDAFENETVERSESISLGALQHIEGDQAYKLPGDADLQKCGAVTIWSTKYRVNFTTAPLRPPGQEMMGR
jgi:hypothetical protein